MSRLDTLRGRLIALREAEIKPAFPETPAERGLLRKGMLEEFIEKRPKTRTEWFQRFPEGIRTSVDSTQISRFLDRVLQIIVECDGGGNYRDGPFEPSSEGSIRRDSETLARPEP